MRHALARLVLGLAALWAATAVHAQPASLVPALFGATTPPPTVAGSFLAGAFSEKGVPYASFLAMPGASFSRNSAAYAENATRSNFVPNSTMAGAAVGTPGTQPTGWTLSNNSDGLTWQVVGLSTQSGFSCIDERLVGTSASTSVAQIYFAPGTTIAAMPGQQFTGSEYGAVVAGSTANLTNITFRRLRTTAAGASSAGRRSTLPCRPPRP